MRATLTNLLPLQNRLFDRIAFDQTRLWMTQMAVRLREWPGESQGAAFQFGALSPDATFELAPPDPWASWVDASGVFSQSGDLGLLRNESIQTATSTVGADYSLREDLLFGLYAGYVGSWAQLPAGARLNSDGARVGGYGRYQLGNLSFSGAVGAIFQEYDWARAIVLPGISRLGIASPSGVLFETMGQIAYQWPIGAWDLELYGQLQYDHLKIDSFTEQGAGSLSYRYADQTGQSLHSQLGGSIRYDFELGENTVLSPLVSLAWRHEFLDGDRTLTSALAAGAGPTFHTALPAVDSRDSLMLTSGFLLRLGQSWQLNCFYTGNYGGGSDLIVHSVNGGFRYLW